MGGERSHPGAARGIGQGAWEGREANATLTRRRGKSGGTGSQRAGCPEKGREGWKGSGLPRDSR